MKAVHVIFALTLGLGAAALLVTQPASARPGYAAFTLGQVELIGLDTNMCTLGITEEMSSEGFLVTDRTSVSDAVLEVTVKTNASPLADQSQMENAHYSAVLIGAGDRVLFATGGSEEAPNLQALCEDIGDNIADQLENSLRS